MESIGLCLPFALNTGDMSKRRVEFRGKFFEFTPGSTGLPTLRDADVLNYCASWLTAAALEGREADISNTLKLTAENFYEFCRINKGGNRDDRLIQTLDRLAGCQINTNTKSFFIKGEGEEATFNYLTRYELERGESGIIQSITVVLPSRFVCYATRPPAGSAMLHPDFFGLSNTRRAIYLIAVLFGGTRSPISFAIDRLKNMIGSNARERDFKQEMLKLQDQLLPEYHVEVDENSSLAEFSRLYDFTPELAK